MVYELKHPFGDRMDIFATTVAKGVHVQTTPTGAFIPDDEIPGLIGALQNYMSKRAKEITKAAANGR